MDGVAVRKWGGLNIKKKLAEKIKIAVIKYLQVQILEGIYIL